MASGMMSSIAIDRNKLPENVMATDIICPSLKHFKLEMNRPKITTYRKNANIRIILMRKVVYSIGKEGKRRVRVFVFII